MSDQTSASIWAENTECTMALYDKHRKVQKYFTHSHWDSGPLRRKLDIAAAQRKRYFLGTKRSKERLLKISKEGPQESDFTAKSLYHCKSNMEGKERAMEKSERLMTRWGKQQRDAPPDLTWQSNTMWPFLCPWHLKAIHHHLSE